MALLAQVVRGCSTKVAKFQLEGATSALCVRYQSTRSPNDTKARRAKELRPRRNYLLNDEVEGHRKSWLQPSSDKDETVPAQHAEVNLPRDYRHVMPDFLPDPNPLIRDRIAEKLERMDMYRRRACIEIPEFYVGSIMAVTMADKHAAGKQSRFVGICIHRGGSGLRANFTLRNVIDGQGLEILFDLYNTTLQSVDVLRLEKRLDDELFYLRDAPPDYSTVPFDFEPVPLPKGATVPVNTTKVKLNSKPWLERWERMNLQGIEPLNLPERFAKKTQEVAKPWEEFDLMKQHRESIEEDEAESLMKEAFAESQIARKARGRQKAGMKKGV